MESYTSTRIIQYKIKMQRIKQKKTHFLVQSFYTLSHFQGRATSIYQLDSLFHILVFVRGCCTGSILDQILKTDEKLCNQCVHDW